MEPETFHQGLPDPQALPPSPQQFPGVDPTGIDEWINSVVNSSSQTVQALLFFVGGLLFGVLCRKYLKFAMWGLLMTFVIVKWFEYQGVLTVDWSGVYALFGMGPSFDINGTSVGVFEWIRGNVVVFSAGLIGFLLGYRPIRRSRFKVKLGD